MPITLIKGAKKAWDIVRAYRAAKATGQTIPKELEDAYNQALKYIKLAKRLRILIILTTISIIAFILMMVGNFGGFGIPGVDMLGLAMGFTESSFGSNQPVASTGSSIGGRDQIVESIQKAKPSLTELDKAANNYFVNSMCSRLPKDKRPSEC